MSADTTPLEEMCELIVDCPHSTPKWTDSGVIVLRNQNIRDGQLDLSSPSYTDEAGYQSRTKRAVPQPGDIVFTREAPMGEVCLIPEGLKCCLGQRQVLLRPKRGISGQYLYWALQSPFVQHQISWNEGTGTTVSNVRIPVLKALEIPRNGDNEGDIARILSSLTEKIQLNHQINQTLEQMAQAIFKSWFVDFDPVKAKIDARERWHALQLGNEPASPVCYAGELDGQPIDVDLDTYMNLAAMQAISGKDADQLAQMQAEQPEQYAELYATAKLFPSAMQDSELGEIPEGWEVRQLGDCLNTLETGGRPKGGVKGITDGVPSVGAENIIGIGNYDYGKEKLIPEEFFNKLKRGVVEHLDCLLYKDGGKPGDFKPRVSMFGCGFPYDKFAINEHVFRLRSDRLGQPFLYCQIGHERVLADLRHRGAKAAIPGINQTDVKTIRIVCPSTEVLGIFHQVAEGLFVSILTRAKENLKLSGTRDTLLPKLLSGELTLPDTEEPQTELQDVAHV